MILNENPTLEELDAAVDAAEDDDDVSLEAYDRLRDLRDTARQKQTADQAKAEETKKAVQDLTSVAEEAKARAEAAKEAPQATAEEKFYAELAERVREREALEAAAAVPFANLSNEDLARDLLDAAITHEELREAAKAERPGTAKAIRANRDAEEAALAWAAIDAERLHRKALADVERGFELNAHRDTMERLRSEDAKALDEIMKRDNIDLETKTWAQQTFAERYAVTVNAKPGDPLPGWTGTPERYQTVRASVEEKLREQMEQARRDFVLAGRGQPRRSR